MYIPVCCAQQYISHRRASHGRISYKGVHLTGKKKLLHRAHFSLTFRRRFYQHPLANAGECKVSGGESKVNSWIRLSCSSHAPRLKSNSVMLFDIKLENVIILSGVWSVQACGWEWNRLFNVCLRRPHPLLMSPLHNPPLFRPRCLGFA
jgi:hypothetical protein